MKLHARLSLSVLTSKQWSAKQFLFFFCVYFISILVLALPDGSATRLSPLTIPNPECSEIAVPAEVIKNCNPVLTLYANAKAHDYLLFFGGGDPGSYVKGGLLLAGKEVSGLSDGSGDIAKQSVVKRLKLINTIGFGMWPPGMFFLNALPLSVSSEFPLGLYQVIVTATLWTVAFALIASFLALRYKPWITIFFPSLIMVFPLFQNYLIRYGVMYSETYGAALMVIGFTFLLLNLHRKSSNILMIVAGTTFALSCFVRSQMLPVVIGVSLIFVLRHFIQKRPFSADEINTDHSIKSINLIFFLIAFYLPIGGYMVTNHGALFHADYMWEYPFKIAAFPNAGAANFVAQGGIRAACEVDIKNCAKHNEEIKVHGQLNHAKSEVIKAFIHHPIRFSIYKLPIAWNYWLEDPRESGYRLDNIFISFLFLICLFYMVFQRLWLILSLTLSTIALLFAPPFLLHFEARYFYLTKVFLLFLPIWLVLFKSDNNLG